MSSRILASSLRRAVINAAKPSLLRVAPSYGRMAQIQPVRFYSDKFSSALKKVLDSEIQDTAADENVLEQPSEDFLNKSGFSVVDNSGNVNVTLTKKTSEVEAVHVFFDADSVTNVPTGPVADNDGANFEQEMDELDQMLPNFKVVVENTSKNSALVAHLVLDSEAALIVDNFYIQENALELLTKYAAGDFAQDSTYQGPPFSMLDESLQITFEEYLASKGVDNELAEFVFAYSEFKEENEYRQWLQSVKTFF